MKRVRLIQKTFGYFGIIMCLFEIMAHLFNIESLHFGSCSGVSIHILWLMAFIFVTLFKEYQYKNTPEIHY